MDSRALRARSQWHLWHKKLFSPYVHVLQILGKTRKPKDYLKTHYKCRRMLAHGCLVVLRTTELAPPLRRYLKTLQNFHPLVRVSVVGWCIRKSVSRPISYEAGGVSGTLYAAGVRRWPFAKGLENMHPMCRHEGREGFWRRVNSSVDANQAWLTPLKSTQHRNPDYGY